MKFSILLAILSCGLFLAFKSFGPQTNYRKVSVNYILPEKIRPDFVNIAKIGFNVVYADGYRIYELKNRKTIKEIIGDSLAKITDTVLYDFFAYKLGSSKGYLLNNLSDSFGKAFSVDSLLTNRALYTMRLDSLLPYATLVRTYQAENHDMVQVYKPVENNYFDTVYYHYSSSKKDIPFSLSEKLDAAHQSKLYKMRVLNRKDTSQYADYINQFRWITIELSEEPVTNKQELDSFFARFREQLKKRSH